MGKLSLTSYSWKCLLGIGTFYVLCLIYGAFLTGSAAELHHALFSLLPGFTWGTPRGVIVGAIDLSIFTWIFAWYYVWMHNTSLVRS